MPVTSTTTLPSRRSGWERSGVPEPSLAGYDIVRLIGKGGMASVYLARQLQLDRLVALKELSPPLAADPEFAKRFLGESRVAGNLAHPNIVTVFDYFEDGGLPYIAMEHLDRGSLRPYVRGRSLAEIAGILDGVLAGLAHAHASGVVHCDLKPENILVTQGGRVKLADFGIARALDQAVGEPAGRPTGTIVYMAPERESGARAMPSVDLWSVGAIAHELLTGELPDGKPLAGFDRRLQDWVRALLDPDPDARPASAAEAGERLEEIVLRLLGARWRRSAVLGVEEPTSAPVHRTPRARQGVLAGVLAASAAVATVFGMGAQEEAASATSSELRDASLLGWPAVLPVRMAGPRTVRRESSGGPKQVRFRVTARRGDTGVAVRCTPRSGSLFMIGTTKVRCAAGDRRRTLSVVVKPPPLRPAAAQSAPARTQTYSTPRQEIRPRLETEPRQGISTS